MSPKTTYESEEVVITVALMLMYIQPDGSEKSKESQIVFAKLALFSER